MGHAALIQTGFNNGEISPYMWGRTDLQKYPLSVRECTNMLPIVQGPAIKRDGSRFVAPAANESVSSRLFEFEFSPTQGYIIEINDAVARFFTNRGLVIEGTKAVTGITQANPAVVTASAHGYSNGQQVKFPAVGPYAALANRVFTVASVTTNTFALSGFNGTSLPAFSGSPTVARVYSIATPYAAADLDAIKYQQAADVMTMLHGSYQPRLLARNGATDWSIDKYVFKDGPYLTEDPTSGTSLTLGDTGSAVPLMTSNTAPSGTVSDSAGDSGAYIAFDRNKSTEFSTGSATTSLVYAFPSGVTKVVDAYWLQAGQTWAINMPISWTLDGYDGTNWVTLDTRDGETGWAEAERRYYTFTNTIAYQKYRLLIHAVDTGANITFARLELHQSADTQTPISLTASNTAGINDGSGFLSTDVGRTIRLMGSDGLWRWARIMSVVSTTSVTVVLYGQAFPDTSPITRFRLGMFSDTTGWPTCGAYYQDRQAFSGPPSYPNYVCFSVPGVYDTFTPSEDDGTVTDASGFAYSLIEQEVTGINWLVAMQRGLIIGTSAGEAIAQPMVTSFTTPAPFSALNIKVVWPTQFGSNGVRPRRCDTATLFVERHGQRVREMAYQIEGDTFTAPDMNAMADHITAGGINRLAFTRHPHRILWSTRADGRLLAFTYERDENVTAWSSHSLGGADVVVEDVAVISSPDGLSEDTWLLVKRTVNGATRRYIEYFGDRFTHTTALADAVFVDASVTYSGTATSTVAGLDHLEGETVRVLADGSQTTDQVVSGGAITIPRSASKITVGLPYTARLWTLRPNGGAMDGTAQGKFKRIGKYVMRLYRSLGGVVKDTQGRTDTVPYWSINNAVTQPLALFSGDTPPRTYPGGWELDGGTVFENDTAYPWTILAFMPRISVEESQ